MSLRIPSDKLKIIAYVTMLVDHLATLLSRHALIPSEVYWLMRGIGRLSFPLFLLLLVIGVHYTRSLPKYIARLSVLAIVSEFPYDLFFQGGFPNWSRQNIFFELLACVILVALLDRSLPGDQDDNSVQSWGRGAAYIVFLTGIMCFPAYFLHFSYGYKGVIATAFLYLFYRAYRAGSGTYQPGGMTGQSESHSMDVNSAGNQERQREPKFMALMLVFLILACVGLNINSTKIQLACFAVIPFIYFLDDKYEKQSRALQFFYYLFYPVHLMLLYLFEIAFL